MSTQHTKNGFILPTILAISFAIIAVMVGLLLVTSTSYKSGYVDHYQKLAEEAAEAGSAYATACLILSSHIQTWGPAANGGAQPDLAPNTDCSGASTYPSHTYVYSDSTVRTYFAVGDLDYSLQFSAQISAQGYAQVLKSDGTVETTYTSIQKKVITWPTEVVGQMSASGSHRTCAIVTYNVYCWGYNAYGQLGDGRYLGSPADIEQGSSIDSLVPVKVHKAAGVMAGKNIVKIFSAQHHSCALSEDGLMFCWGYGVNGQLGQGNTADSPVPVQVGGALAGKVITDIGGTNSASCAIAESKIYCWGANVNGVTGRGTTSGSTLTPTLVTASDTPTTLATSYTATALSTSGSRSKTMCAIAGGKAYCWGDNNNGSVGNGTTSSSVTVPTKVTDTGVLSGKTVTAISQDGYVSSGSGGYPHVCAIASGEAFCWGDNNSGQLGDNSTADRSSPVAVVTSGVLSGKTIEDIQAGLNHTCVRADSAAYCWGNNGSGQLGDGTNTSRDEPTTVSQQPGGLTSSNVVSIGGGSNRGCAVVLDGRTFCWGLNGQGQIGDGTTTNRNVPTESLFLRPTGNQYIF